MYLKVTLRPRRSRSQGDVVSAARSNGQPVKSAARTVEVLDFFARHPGLHTLGSLQKSLGYPKSSLYVLLRTLLDLGWIETDPTGTLYRIGLRALLVGTSYIDTDDVVAGARSALDRLAAQTGEACHLARLDGSDVVYLATRESRHYLRPFSRVGRRLPAYATALGKSLLADRRDHEVRTILADPLTALTKNTLTDPLKLMTDLARVRRRGYAVDREESTIGLRCFGVALRYERPARDAISCSVPAARMSAERESQIVEELFQARDEIDRIMGSARVHKSG
jgi:IclR family transcriptional regulator, acetate operon repressor